MKPKRLRFDVLGLGTVAVDQLIVADAYPPADAKVRVRHTERQCGGLTAIALIAAARLGSNCAYAGALGRDDVSDFAVEQLKREGIDVRFLKRGAFAPAVESFIVIDSQTGTRNVFSHRVAEYKVPAHWPPRTLIESTRVLFVDHSGLPAMIRAATIARAAGIPIVADLERNSGPEFPRLLELVDHLIVSERFALQFTRKKTVPAAVKALWSNTRSTVVVTCGERGCVYIDCADPTIVRELKAFSIEALDTTGCGDVFHGAYAAALAKGWPTDERIRFASAAAALKTKRIGAQAGIPTLPMVKKFLRQHKITN